MKRQTHFFVCRYTFIWLHWVWLYSPNGDLPLCMREYLRLYLFWDFSYSEAFCLRMELVCNNAIVVGCSCLSSSANRSRLRSRFSFCLSWSICSCDYPPCRKVYCLLVYHCLCYGKTPWYRTLHWWRFLQMVVPYECCYRVLTSFSELPLFWSHYFSDAKVAWCFDWWNPSCAVASLWPIK